MAPGLVYPQTHDERQHFPSYDERVIAATPPSSHASPVLRAVALDARPFAPSTGEQQQLMEGAAEVDLLVENFNKAVEIQNEQARRLHDLMHAYPRLSRAYSEGSLPAPTSTDASAGSAPPHTPPEGAATIKSAARYQATVEDCTESEAEEDCPTPASSDDRLTPPPPGKKDSKSSDQDRPPARRHTISASAPTSPSAAHAVVVGASSPPTIVKEVRFSDRPPSVLQRSASARHSGSGGVSSQQQTRSYQPQPRERAVQSLQDDRWGTLFTPQGKATSKMRDALRGLAMHLIEVYKPTHSLVVTPEKLHKFYSRYGLDREDINLVRMFSLTSRDAMENLERVFLSLNCEFHVVQDTYSAGGRPRRPYIPALTPEGFVQWSITLIRACPDQEAVRLARVFADIDLEARPEDPSLVEGDDAQRGRRRLPRQISRYLFPAEANASELRLLTDTMRQWRYATEAASASRSPDRPAAQSSSVQNKPLIHSDARSRQEHLHRPRKDYDHDYERDAAAVMVPQGGGRKDREYRLSGGSSRYASKSHARGESPRRSSSKRYDRRERDGKESERDRRRGERRWSADSYDEPRHRRRDARGSRA
ncbi:hypothetical protein ISF_01956 [Cordyceps fumosorosea ARSEF 2679]|uniref:DUF7514 domain-containing protein n=1 Tax=Cordyceps fumosorosea (strain ARSEF 2679) TaxID=1081104 RepID=A0A168CI34_CORFA|nr:hypothetical protein ISF_01956 [Cordyceps fumosorosea ARSEF 2679]OAA71405.1 hypothetical protein ISF_01956 [Cordyceps fumosorosea ARSEF 2679]